MPNTSDIMTLPEALNRLAPPQRPKRGDLSSVSNDSSERWDLNTPFEKAVTLATIGWQEQAREIWKILRSLAPAIDCKFSQNYDVTGEAVDIGRFLSGEPECMLSNVVPDLSVVRVLVNIAARCDADARLIFNRGAAVAAVIHALQGGGRNVSLAVQDNVSAGYYGGNENHETRVEVESAGEYINPGRLAFWLAHPAALRRCMFRFNEQQSSEIRRTYGFHELGGYGSPANLPKEQIEKGMVYIPFPETNELEAYDTPQNSLKRIVKYFEEQGIPIKVKLP